MAKLVIVMLSSLSDTHDTQRIASKQKHVSNEIEQTAVNFKQNWLMGFSEQFRPGRFDLSITR